MQGERGKAEGRWTRLDRLTDLSERVASAWAAASAPGRAPTSPASPGRAGRRVLPLGGGAERSPLGRLRGCVWGARAEAGAADMPAAHRQRAAAPCRLRGGPGRAEAGLRPARRVLLGAARRGWVRAGSDVRVDRPHSSQRPLLDYRPGSRGGAFPPRVPHRYSAD